MAASSAQIAAALGVPKSTVLRRAAAEGWAYTEQRGQGGLRRAYTVEQLPAAIRAKLLWANRPDAGAPPEARAAAQAGRAEAARRSTALRQAAELPAGAQARLDARLAVLRALEACAATACLPLAQARLLFSDRYNAGEVDVPAAVRALVPRTSDSTLERWQRDVRRRGIAALGGNYGNRAGSGSIDTTPELHEFVQAMLVQHPHCRSTQVMRGLQARFTGRVALPSMRSLERWVAAWRTDNREVLQALANPDAWKNRYMTAFGSASEQVTAINALWERDSSPADVMCSDGRYSLIGGIDVFSRSARLLVSRTSRAVAVGAHLRAMLLAFGVPQADKTDNGSDYTALYTDRVYDGLDIEHRLCEPFQPWMKPHIERFFGTFSRDLVELLPGYIGHSVAERSAIEARRSFADRLMKRGEVVELRMTGAELQAFCDRWVETIYDHQPHDGLQQQRTPFEVRTAHAHEVRRIDDERALDILLAEAPGRDGRRTVQKKGIKLDEGWFIAPELHDRVGHEVQVRFDPFHHDLGTIHVFGGDELRFICIAQNPDRTGVDRREVAIKTKALQRTRVQDERRALRAAAKAVGVDQVVGEILRERAAATGKLKALPVRTTTHTSPGLRAASAAAAAAAAPQRTTADIEDLAAVQAARSRIEAAAVPADTPNELADRRGPAPAPVFENVGQRVQWLLDQAHVRHLGAEEQDTLAGFKREHLASYRRMAAAAADKHPNAKNTEEPCATNSR